MVPLIAVNLFKHNRTEKKNVEYMAVRKHTLRANMICVQIVQQKKRGKNIFFCFSYILNILLALHFCVF